MIDERGILPAKNVILYIATNSFIECEYRHLYFRIT